MDKEAHYDNEIAKDVQEEKYVKFLPPEFHSCGAKHHDERHNHDEAGQGRSGSKK